MKVGRIVLFVMILALLAFGPLPAGMLTGNEGVQQSAVKTGIVENVEAATEVRGLWLAFCDFERLGLKNRGKAQFAKKIRKILKNAVYYGKVNTLYFHVRAFDDASWKSKTFKASKYLTSKASSKKTAYKTYSYDPLSVVINEAHRKGIKVHAWMNPYRHSYSYYYNPARKYSTDRLLAAADEVMKYDIDGIHFDDYFYSAGKGYYKAVYRYGNRKGKPVKNGSTAVAGKSRIKLINEGKLRISKATKRLNVNAMVRTLYKKCHTKRGFKFGISPAGNYENAMAIGADVKTWLSKTGYVDYIVPQIYWTDQWGDCGKIRMFSNRLKIFKRLNKLKKPMYIGLALYRTGYCQCDDAGWGWKNTNIRNQIKKLRKYGMNGYVLFSAPDLFDGNSAKERYHMKGIVNPVMTKSIKIKIDGRIVNKLRMKKGKLKTLKIVWRPLNTNPKRKTTTSSNPKVVKVMKSGKIKALRTGKATIKVRTNNGKVAKLRVTVRKR